MNRRDLPQLVEEGVKVEGLGQESSAFVSFEHQPSIGEGRE
jgi:hypothetical protein